MRSLAVQALTRGHRLSASILAFPQDDPTRAKMAPARQPKLGNRKYQLKQQTIRSMCFMPKAGVQYQLADSPLHERTHPSRLVQAAEAVSFFTDLGTVGRNDPDDVKRQANADQLGRVGATTVQVWTDASVTGDAEDQHAAAGGAFIAYDVLGNEVAALSGMMKPSKWSCSYSAERPTLLAALRAATSAQHVESMAFFTDSLSTVKALQRGPLAVRGEELQEIWYQLTLLHERGTKLSLAFVFSHCGTTRNEAVDRRADAARVQRCPEMPTWTPDAARARMVVHRRQYDEDCFPEVNGRTFRGKYCRKPTKPKTLQIFRSHYRLLLQLRVGVSRRLGGWRHETTDPCPQCHGLHMTRGGGAVEHLFQCTATAALQLRARHGVTSTVDLWNAPERAARYAAEFIRSAVAG